MYRHLAAIFTCFLLIIPYGLSLDAYAETPENQGEVIFSDIQTPAGEAYASYYNAIMNGDLIAVRKWVESKNLEKFDDASGKKMVSFFQTTMPRKLSLIREDIKGGAAHLLAEGHSSMGKVQGNIDMIQEGGVWKVVKDKWKKAP